LFFFSSRRRHTRFSRDWSFRRVLFRSSRILFRMNSDLLTDKKANDTASEFIRSKIREIVKDPETAAKLTAFDHPYAAKRPPIDRSEERRVGKECRAGWSEHLSQKQHIR